jgi:RNA methyltransferase, TrmH family
VAGVPPRPHGEELAATDPVDAHDAVIASRDNARVQAARRLQQRKHRERERRFLVEGPHALDVALTSGAPLVEVFHLWGDPSPAVAAVVAAASERGVRCVPVTRTVIEALATTDTPQGVVGVCRHVDVGVEAACRASSAGPVAVLVEVQDPGNLGTVLRSADAAGAGSVILTRGSVDLYNPKVVRASAGALFAVPVARDVPLDRALRALHSSGVPVLAAAAGAGASVFDADLTGAAAFLFGNEARGLPDAAREGADATIGIPIRGHAESLNLAAAATVVLFEAARQRNARDARRSKT